MEPDLTSLEPARRPQAREARAASGKAHLTLVSSRQWAHTLVLTGELDGRSAPALEEEIEGLCQEGVAGLRLDLRRLDRIDGVGVAVIAFRSQECVRLGCDFDVIADSPGLRSALTDAGVVLAQPEPARSNTPKFAVCPDESAGAEVPEIEATVGPGKLGRLAKWRAAN